MTQFVKVATFTSNIGGGTFDVYANGQGLANALESYDSDGAGFVTSKDGALIGWGQAATDVYANVKDAFWGILADQHVQGVTEVAHDASKPFGAHL
jgi:hypothetical protein